MLHYFLARSHFPLYTTFHDLKNQLVSIKSRLWEIDRSKYVRWEPSSFLFENLIGPFYTGSNLMLGPNAGPYYASYEKITPIRAGLKRAKNVVKW